MCFREVLNYEYENDSPTRTRTSRSTCFIANRERYNVLEIFQSDGAFFLTLTSTIHQSAAARYI